jgi:hypothetical protein
LASDSSSSGGSSTFSSGSRSSSSSSSGVNVRSRHGKPGEQAVQHPLAAAAARIARVAASCLRLLATRPGIWPARVSSSPPADAQLIT